MDNHPEVGELLVPRRAESTAEWAALPAGTDRRVPGRRRTAARGRALGG
jgi:hypothetical protein